MRVILWRHEIMIQFKTDDNGKKKVILSLDLSLMTQIHINSKLNMLTYKIFSLIEE